MSTHYNANPRKRYTIGTFLWDFFMLCITGGLWFFYLLFRMMRTR